MSKRQRLVLTSFLLATGFLVITNLNELVTRYLGIVCLSFLALGLTLWALKEGLHGIEWLMIPVLPFLYTFGASLFYFLLPANSATLWGVTLVFGFGMYILLLTENIFSVAAVRTIPLVRSASSVAFLFTLVTGFFLLDIIFSFRLPFWLNCFWVFMVSFLLFLQNLWSVELAETLERKVVVFSLIPALILGQLVLAVSFWPVSVALASLFLTTAVYVMLGLIQAKLTDRLFKKTVQEYLVVGLGVLITLFLTTNWGG